MAPPRIPLLFAALLLISRTASALQVTPNSPCAAVCQDQPQFDVSAPKSSNTKNGDIFCKDVYHNGPTESKWKTCMTCLQSSTFAQGGENDMMWFLYNLRYSLSYCVFAYPNATDAGSTPCSTTMACGPLRDSFIHGITDQKDMSAYSYCQAPGAMDTPHYDRCVSCVSAEGKTEILANSVIALEAGCLQQPAIGGVLGLNDTIFAPTTIKIVDPLTLIKDTEATGLPGGTIAGIVGGALAVLVIVSAITFVCYRKRKNRRARADFEAGRNSRFRHRHQSSMSFQCQTHAMSPRFWPGGGGSDDATTPVNDTMTPPHPDTTLGGRRSSLWKPHNSMSSFENTLDARSEKTWTNSPYQEDLPPQESSDSFPPHPNQNQNQQKRLATLHTSIPSLPRNAHMSPSTTYHSPADMIRTPMSAESTRSTTALLPGIKPYVPADHGVHVTHNNQSPQPTGLSAFSSPVSASGWQAQAAAPRGSRMATSPPAAGADIGLAISNGVVPPPAVPWIKAPGMKKNQNKNGAGAGVGAGTPVESWEVKTSFELPPPPPKR